MKQNWKLLFVLVSLVIVLGLLVWAAAYVDFTAVVDSIQATPAVEWVGGSCGGGCTVSG